MSITKQGILDALKQVIFFKKQNNIVDLGMVHELHVTGNQVRISVVFPELADPSVAIVVNSINKVLKTEFGNDITVDIKPMSEKELGKGPLAGVKNIIAVISGKGGVGKSTVAANLAIALSKAGKSVGILDADIMGPSVPIMLGVEGEKPGLIERDGKGIMIPLENYGIKILSIGFFVAANQALRSEEHTSELQSH